MEVIVALIRLIYHDAASIGLELEIAYAVKFYGLGIDVDVEGFMTHDLHGGLVPITWVILISFIVSNHGGAFLHGCKETQ